MAIEIVPQKNDSENNPLLDVFFYIAISLLATMVLLYFGIKYFDAKTAEKYKEVQIEISKKETAEALLKEKQVIAYRDKINNYSEIFSKHTITSNAFSYLEKFIHPKVVFSWFNIDQESGQLSLSGTTDGFESLGQQILLFEGSDLADNVVLKKVTLEKNGSVAFQVEIIFKKQIFAN